MTGVAEVRVLCLTCHQPTPKSRIRKGKCDHCFLSAERIKDRSLQRRAQKAKYDPEHRRLREAFRPLVEAGEINCARCHEPIEPGTPWDLDHIDGTEHPSHPACNRGAASRAGARRAIERVRSQAARVMA